MTSDVPAKTRPSRNKAVYLLGVLALPVVLAAAARYFTDDAGSNALLGLTVSDASVGLIAALSLVSGMGAALLLASAGSSRESGMLPYTILAVGVCVSVCIWIALLYEDQEDLEQVLDAHVQGVAYTIAQDFDEREKMLRRMVRRWEYTGRTPETEWNADAAEYVNDKPGFQAIEWIDRDFQIRWVVPLAGNEAALGLDLCFEPRRCAALQAARDRGGTSVSQSIDLVQGGKGFLVYEPIFVAGEFDGLITAVFRIDTLMDQLLHGFPENLNVLVNEQVNGTAAQLYLRREPGSSTVHFAAAAAVQLANNQWQIELAPTRSFLAAHASPYPHALLAVCLLLTMLLALSSHYSRVAHSRESLLAKQKAEQELVMDNVPAIVAYYDKNLRYRVVNRRFSDYFGGEPRDFEGKTAREVFGEDAFNEAYPHIKRALEGENVEYELQVPGKDGALRWMAVHYVPEWDNRGRVHGIFALVHDIHGERMAQQALRESEQRFQFASEGSSDGLWDWVDVTKDEVWWSPRFYELLGYAPDALEARISTFNELLHPDDRGRMEVNVAAIQKGEDPPEPMEYRMRMANGEYRWFRSRSKQFMDAETGGRRIAGSIQDIHEEKVAKDALATTQERFRVAVEGSSDGLWDWFDVSQDQEWWSPSFYELLGYKPGEIASNLETFKTLLHPDDHAGAFAAVEANLRAGVPFDVEYRLKKKSGEYRWFRARANVHADKSTGVTRMAGSLQDISDRKEAEAALADSEQRWRLAAAGSTDGMWDWNVRTSEVWYAPRWKSQLGYEPHEIPDNFAAFEDRLHPDDRERVMAAAQAHMEHKGPFDIEYRMRTKSGDYVWHRARGQALFDEDGVAFRMAGSNQDISAEKAADARAADYMERLAAANASLRQRNEELDEFTYIASHDLQEPLRKLSNFAELLQHDVPAEALNDDALFDLKTIQSAAARMRTLVQDLLELSRSGRHDMEMQDISLDECLDQALDALSLRIAEDNAEIVRAALPQVLGDRSLLTQVFQNLVGNALKFSKDKQAKVSIDAARDGDRWVVAVADNGIGIEEQYRKQIFAPFKRLHGRDQYEGTGIGLAICRKILGRHGGTIWAEETPGGGTTFKFSVEAAGTKNLERAV